MKQCSTSKCEREDITRSKGGIWGSEMEWYRVVQMGDSGTSLGVGSELVLRIEPEFEVQSCVTWSHNTTTDGDNAPHLLPPILTNDTIPQSILAACQAFKLELSKVWKRSWAHSPCFACMENIDPSLPSRKYRTLTDVLTRAQSSVITQLQTGHIPLYKHLYCIKKVATPLCPTCSWGDKSILHFLFECCAHEHACISLREVMGCNAKCHHWVSTIGCNSVLLWACTFRMPLMLTHTSSLYSRDPTWWSQPVVCQFH